jgi:hypothetical protein
MDDKKKITYRTSIDPNVPISKPLPNNDTYRDEEKNEAIKKTSGIAPAKSMSLSLGKVNFPSPNLAMSQKNIERVVPTERRKPLLASRVTGTYGMKKNKHRNKVANNVTNDNLLKNLILFDSIFVCNDY